jgi:hypothetical protein
MAKTGYSAVKQVSGSYWYKIGGKNVTKAAYNAYDNPVGDGPTKSTNDPDASGNKAKIQKNRSTNKASKRPTALTKKQTELKNQGTKITKKPPFKQKVPKSPLEFGWKDALDYGQTALTAVGTIPGVGIIADGANTLISGGRAGYAAATGDKAGAKKYAGDMAMNAAMMVPVVGQGVAGTKLAYATGKGVLKAGGKELAKQTGKNLVKKGGAAGLKKVNNSVMSNKKNNNVQMTMNNTGRKEVNNQA